MFIMLEVSWESHEECCVVGLPWAAEVRGFRLLAQPQSGAGANTKPKQVQNQNKCFFKRMVLKVKHSIILK